MANSVAVGAILGLFGLDIDVFAAIAESAMHKKGEGVIATNITVAQAGLDFVLLNYPDIDSFKITQPQEKGLMLINGNQAIGLGALLSGCRFFAAYPMTPSTSIMVYLAGKAKEYGIIVEQAEDEIAAINMALGASFGGVRAMTATSGGGYALMTEGVSLAGITETPIVIAEVQRPGPATGLPTRTEQGDLFFVLYGGHGEFPRVVLTPGTPEQAFYLTNKAFHLAEKYQIPVIIMSDQYLADSEWTFSGFDAEQLLYEDFRLRGESLRETPSYQRYQYTENGVSPLAVPGEPKHLVVVDSDEHDEDGHIIEDAQTRTAMVEKRLHKKMPLLRQEIAPPTFHGDGQARILLVGYGSTYGVMKEAVDILSEKQPTGMLHFSEVCPFPLVDEFDYVAVLKQAALAVCVENNATGQFARLIRMETGFEFAACINKYDGRPFGLDTLLGEINDHLQGL
jgi:2-oxoglutarate ferredoxin oxidoreductase subunit alpha